MNRFARMLTILLLVTKVVNAGNFLFSPINVSHGLSDNQIRYMLQLPDGRMVFTTSGNLNLYDGTHFKYIHRNAPNIYTLNKYDGFYRIYQAEDSLLWIKDHHKLMCVNLKQETYIPNLSAYFKSRGIVKTVDDFFVDAEQRWWLLTPEGLLQYDTSEMLSISDNRGDLQDLTTDSTNLYLFYNTGEVVCYNLKTKNKRYTKAAYSVNEQAHFQNTSLIVKGENGIYQLRNGSKGGFFFFDTKKLVWEKLLETNYTLNTLIVMPNETAYVSCANGFWLINRRNATQQYLPVLKTVNGNTIATEISTIFYDKQGGLWLGTLNRGLLYYHPDRYKFSYIGHSYFQQASTEDFTVQAFAEDEFGNIFVKCQSKIYQFHSSEESVNTLKNISSVALPKHVLDKLNHETGQTFQGIYYTALLTDSRGWKWMGTQDGLRLLKPNTQEKFFYTEDGLSNNFVHAIIEDRKHNLWITTSCGISKIQIDSVSERIRFVNFNAIDGTLDGEYADGAAYEAKDGTLYFGGVNGFNLLKSDKVSSTPLPFQPVFTNLFLRGEKVETQKEYDGHIILPQATAYTKELVLAYNQNFLTLEFSANNYLNQANTHYRYQLQGIDEDWIETFAGRESFGTDGILRVSYTNLPHGEYVFKVMASGNDNQWEAMASEIKITIRAPWWKTKTAYFFYLLSLVTFVSLSVFLYTYFSRKKLERQHREEMLLLKIRNLIEQYNLLEAEKETVLSKPNLNTKIPDENSQLNAVDAEFLSKAIALVEMNLNEPNYSVELLSRDLCMDRTGLYRKLIAILDKSPSLFIRNIRLQRAAQLILDGQLNITEIAEKVGFSSSSYLSKCFHEMYGCRPSEYAEKVKRST